MCLCSAAEHTMPKQAPTRATLFSPSCCFRRCPRVLRISCCACRNVSRLTCVQQHTALDTTVLCRYSMTTYLRYLLLLFRAVQVQHDDIFAITCFCFSETASDIAKILVAPWTCLGAACRPRPGSSSFSLASIVGLAMHSAARIAASTSDLVCTYS